MRLLSTDGKSVNTEGSGMPFVQRRRVVLVFVPPLVLLKFIPYFGLNTCTTDGAQVKKRSWVRSLCFFRVGSSVPDFLECTIIGKGFCLVASYAILVFLSHFGDLSHCYA